MTEIIDAEYVLISPVIHNLPGPESASPDAVANCNDTCTEYYCGRCNDMHECGSGLDDPDDEPDCCKGAELCRKR